MVKAKESIHPALKVSLEDLNWWEIYLREEARASYSFTRWIKKGCSIQRLKSDSWFDYVQYVGKNFLFDIRSSKTISITHWVPLY